MPSTSPTTSRAVRPTPATARHDEIVAAAAELFHRNGYPGTSIQQIADRVGILKGSLYHHIRSKADLLHRVIEGLHDTFLAAMDDDLRNPEGTAVERAERILDRHLDILLSNMDAASVYRNSMEHLERGTRRRLMRERGAYERHVAELVAEAQRLGQIRDDIDPGLLTSLAFAAINAPSIWPPRKVPYPIDDVRHAVRGLLQDGFRPRDQTPG